MNKEKQSGDCKNYNSHEEKQIEEMSTEIQKAVNGCSSYWSGLIAEHLYEQGYRKQSEGEWEEYQLPHIICCSECDWGTGVEDKRQFHYCPNCGAKMKGGAE